MPKTEPSDPNDLGQIMQQMLAQNAAAAEAVTAGAQAAFDEAAAQHVGAQAALREMELNKATIAAEFYDLHRAHIEKDLRQNIVTELTRRLLPASGSSSEVAELLEVPDGFVIAIARELGMTAWEGDSGAQQPSHQNYVWITYENQGRGGTVVFHLGKTVCRFWFEIAGAGALVIIETPKEAHWEAQTGLSLAQRPRVLDYIGQQFVTDQAPGYKFRIEPDSIVIY